MNGRPVAIDGFSLNRNASNDLGGHTTSNPEFQATVGVDLPNRGARCLHFSAVFPGKSAARRTSRTRLSDPERDLKGSGPRSTLTHPESSEGFFYKFSHSSIGMLTWLTHPGECSKQRLHQVLRMTRLRLLFDEADRGQLDGF